MSEKPRHVFLCGIGGSGMSSLALVLLSQGCKVSGSDRACDEGQTPEKFAQLKKAGINIAPQDGTGLDASVDALIVSSAIEDTIPDVAAARKLSIPIFKRADVLAENFNRNDGIAVGGTSGKSTVTAMLGHILREADMDPTVINGAAMVNAIESGAGGLGNALIGASRTFVIEADESDGTIALYNPAVSVLTNVSLDHKPVAETLPLFRAFLERARNGAVVNLDNAGAASLAGAHAHTLTFSIGKPEASLYATDLEFDAGGSAFVLHDGETGEQKEVKLLVPGRHNIENALAAIAAAKLDGVPLDDAVRALEGFKGIKRRLEILGKEDGVTVIDDFGHNPDKIAASLAALKQARGRLLVVFQPHGFSPMRLMGKEIAAAFAEGLGKEDILILPDILYKGGTVTRDVSSADTVREIVKGGRQALHIPEREDIGDFLAREAKPGDRIVIMGARDDSLTDFAFGVLRKLKARGRGCIPKTPEL